METDLYKGHEFTIAEKKIMKIKLLRAFVSFAFLALASETMAAAPVQDAEMQAKAGGGSVAQTLISEANIDDVLLPALSKQKSCDNKVRAEGHYLAARCYISMKCPQLDYTIRSNLDDAAALGHSEANKLLQSYIESSSSASSAASGALTGALPAPASSAAFQAQQKSSSSTMATTSSANPERTPQQRIYYALQAIASVFVRSCDGKSQALYLPDYLRQLNLLKTLSPNSDFSKKMQEKSLVVGNLGTPAGVKSFNAALLPKTLANSGASDSSDVDMASAKHTSSAVATASSSSSAQQLGAGPRQSLFEFAKEGGAMFVFGDGNKGVHTVVNEAIEQQLKLGKKDYVKPYDPDVEFALLSVSKLAIEWLKPFDLYKTKDKLFTRGDGATEKRKFMSDKVKARILKNGDNVSLLIPMKNESYFLLHKPAKQTSGKTELPGWDNLTDMIKQLYFKPLGDVNVSIPHVELNSEIDLLKFTEEQLKLSGIRDLALGKSRISEFTQSIKYKHDEKGAEALAVTQGLMAMCAVPNAVMDSPYQGLIFAPVGGELVPILAITDMGKI